MKPGQIRFFARRFLAGEPVPVFRDNRINRAIGRYETRILRARTFRRRPGPQVADYDYAR